jgi:hypothetical protein
MRALRKVTGAPRSLFDRDELPFEELQVTSTPLPPATISERLARGAALPRLVALDLVEVAKDLDPGHFRPMWQPGCLGERLRQLRLPGQPTVWPWLHEITTVQPPPEKLEIVAGPTQWSAIVSRVDGGQRLRLSHGAQALGHALDELLRELAQLDTGANLRSVEVVIPKGSPPFSEPFRQLRGVLARFER